MKTSSVSEQFASAVPYDRYLQAGTGEQQRRWTTTSISLSLHLRHCQGGPPPSNLSSRPDPDFLPRCL